MDKGFAFAGANAYRVDKIVPVQELMDSLTEEYAAEASTKSMPTPTA
jgi:hypothetical protein